MAAAKPLKRIAFAFLLLWFVPTSVVAAEDEQEDRQEEEDRQEDLSANNTAFRGAQLLERGSQAYAEGVQTNSDTDHTSDMFWSGDTLNFEVRSQKTGNRVAAKFEFFWFEAGLDRGSDFYVALIRGNSSPNLGGDCLDYSWRDPSWELGVEKLAQFIDVQAPTSGQGGAIRWDWSIPFQTYRWEPKQDVTIDQSYSVGGDLTANGSVEGEAQLVGSKGPESAGDKSLNTKGSIEGNGTAEASHSVSTNYTITLYRWEMQVNSGPTGIKWGLQPLDPKSATDNAYHEYYLVLQSESAGQPVVVPEINFGGTFQCPRWWKVPNKTETLDASVSDIRLSPPPVPECSDDEIYQNGGCQPKCDSGEVYDNGSCREECASDEVYKNGQCQEEEDDSGGQSCQKDRDCSPGNICQSGSCVPSECTRSDDCNSDEVCDLGRCKKVECKSDSDCKSGEKCTSDGQCIVDPDKDDSTETDTGTQTGGPDTGFSDTGSGGVGQNEEHQYSGGCSAAGDGRPSAPIGGFALLLVFGLAGWIRRKSRDATDKGGSRNFILVAAALMMAVATIGCGGESPTILPIGNKTADVGETLEFDVVAEGANSLDAENLPEGARFNVLDSGEGRFSWSPLISQTGTHDVDFYANNENGETSKRIQIDVSGGCQGPEIIGSTNWVIGDRGETLQRSIQVREDHCAEEIEWETSEMPDGMTFTPLVKRATVHWEPSEAQWDEEEYEFEVTVTNGEGKSTSESIVIQLGQECPGTPAPSVESTTPSAQQGPNDYPVNAQITAERESDIQEAVLYYATGADPEPEQFIDVDMSRRSQTSDVWEATVTLDEDLEDGESADVTYRICAVNTSDSEENSCSVQGCTDHLMFTAQMGTAGGLCTECDRDGDCGGPNDRCVAYGPTSAHCGIDCSSTNSCPRGYDCKTTTGGHEQCVRNSDCGGSGEHRAAESGDLIINEVLAHPPGDANGDEVDSGTADQFVEFISTASEIIDVGNYKLQKDHDTRYEIPPGTTVAPGQSLVIFGGGDPVEFEDFGTDLVFSAREDRRADVGMLQLARSGDTVRLANRDGEEVTALAYGDESDEMGDDIANEGESITRAPQVQGSSWIKHGKAPGAGGETFSPGRSSCGKRFPIEVHGGCGGEHCLGRATDRDVEDNNSLKNAVCISNLPNEIQGSLHYKWSEPEAPGPDPADFFEVQLANGEMLHLRTMPGPEPDVSNTKLQVLSESGEVLEENLNRHEVSDWYSEIDEFQAPREGNYYVRVATPQGNTKLEGTYILRVEPVDTDQ